MKVENYAALEFPSRSANEGFARAAAACFLASIAILRRASRFPFGRVKRRLRTSPWVALRFLRPLRRSSKR